MIIKRKDDTEYINSEITDLDGDRVIIINSDGFGACNIQICCHTLTWKQVDELKEAIKLAEKEWRK